ncbi:MULTISPECIES: hypothetical protein [unclassified Massilia]|nr:MULTISPECIES: hypothetical protein [unclassified Massilia]
MNQIELNGEAQQETTEVVALDISEITRREEMAEDAGICICSTMF